MPNSFYTPPPLIGKTTSAVLNPDNSQNHAKQVQENSMNCRKSGFISKYEADEEGEAGNYIPLIFSRLYGRKAFFLII